jgi:hypothetical protein
VGFYKDSTLNSAGDVMELKRRYQWFLGFFGIIVIAIAMAHIVMGPAIVPDSWSVSASMDSEYRFFASMFLAFGVALLFCIKRVETRSTLVNFLALAFFAGGLARLVSMYAVGLPHPFLIMMTFLELFLPLVMFYLQYRVSRPVPASDEKTAVENSPV